MRKNKQFLPQGQEQSLLSYRHIFLSITFSIHKRKLQSRYQGITLLDCSLHIGCAIASSAQERISTMGRILNNVVSELSLVFVSFGILNRMEISKIPAEVFDFYLLEKSRISPLGKRIYFRVRGFEYLSAKIVKV